MSMTINWLDDGPFKGFPFPREFSPLQKHLYCAGKNICSGSFVHRKTAMQIIWTQEAVVWHTWIDRALKVS
jgi:hypothetical protein